MPKINITQEYLRFRLVLTLLLMAGSIGIAYIVTTKSFNSVVHKVEIVVIFEDALTAMTESIIYLDGIRYQENYTAIEPLRTKLSQSALLLENVITTITEQFANGTMDDEVLELLENDTLDTLGLLDDFHYISEAMAEPDAPWGRDADRLVTAAHATTDQILPILRRLNVLELEDLDKTNANMQKWVNFLVAIMLAVLVGIGRFVFYPMEKNIVESHKEIQLKQQQAEAASVAKSDFLSTMSHEIRTPMNGVLGMAEILNNTTLQPDQRQMVEVIGSSGRDLMIIIEDILDFSKIEANKLVLEERQFKLSQVLDHLQQLLGPMATQKGVEYRCEVSDALEQFHVGDKGRVQQILTNLIGNAIKFTDSGSVVINVTADPIFRGAQGISISVTDTGIGIKDEHLEQIFEQFEQADNTSTRRFGGTGLGLTISSRLADAMGGNISVNSEAGQGTTFTFAVSLRLQKVVPPSERAIQYLDEAQKFYQT